MKAARINNLFTRIILVASMAGLSPSVANGSVPTCVEGTQIKICVEWSQLGSPELNVDFRVLFTDPANPSVELRTGDVGNENHPGWIVYAEKVSDGSPANIGALTIDPSTSSENFRVRIAKGTGPGAANVGTINLNAASWSGHSSLADGSRIAGDLTGNLTVVRSGASGGEGGGAQAPSSTY
jgi:hypothetical protein